MKTTQLVLRHSVPMWTFQTVFDCVKKLHCNSVLSKKARSQGQKKCHNIRFAELSSNTIKWRLFKCDKIFCYISFLKEILNQIIQKIDELRGKSKSLYRNRAGRHFYGTENEIWAGFGPVGNTEKKFGLIMSNFWGCFFHVFMGQISLKIFRKIVASA